MPDDNIVPLGTQRDAVRMAAHFKQRRTLLLEILADLDQQEAAYWRMTPAEREEHPRGVIGVMQGLLFTSLREDIAKLEGLVSRGFVFADEAAKERAELTRLITLGETELAELNTELAKTPEEHAAEQRAQRLRSKLDPDKSRERKNKREQRKLDARIAELTAKREAQVAAARKEYENSEEYKALAEQRERLATVTARLKAARRTRWDAL
jgi:hypothetical protein